MRRTRKNSGQILLIAAFIMASLLLSTQLYILEVGKIAAESTADSASDFVLAVKTSSKRVVIGSLANVSHGGRNNVLTSNLDRWRVVIGNQYKLGKTVLDYTLLETAPYSTGLWIDWTANGVGTSSAYVDFVHKLSDQEINVNYPYSINVTTTALVESSYRIVGGDTKQVNATITLLTEEGPVLAEQVTVYYELSGIWLIPSDYTIIDYGNGTYRASFTVDIPSEIVQVSTHVVDQRGIYVQANVTSTQA